MYNFKSLYDLEDDLYRYIQTTDVYLRCLVVDLKVMDFEVFLDTINIDTFNKYLNDGILGCKFKIYNIGNKCICKLKSLYIDKYFIHGYYNSVIRMNLSNIGYGNLELSIIDDKLYLNKISELRKLGKNAFPELLDYKSILI